MLAVSGATAVRVVRVARTVGTAKFVLAAANGASMRGAYSVLGCCGPQRTGNPRRVTPKYFWLVLENSGQASVPRVAVLAGFGFAGFATHRKGGFAAGFGAGARAGAVRRTTGIRATGVDVLIAVNGAAAAGFTTGFGAAGVLVTRATLATGFGAGTGLAAGFGAGFGVGAEAAATAFPSDGWKPQTTVRFRATRGTHLTLPSIPARM